MSYGFNAGRTSSVSARSVSSGNRRVMPNDMVAHVWAAQSQAEAKSNNGNFYFEGRKLFSYGSHFVVGYIADESTVLLNSDGYSPTTGQHKSDASRATRHMTQIRVPKLQTLVQDGRLDLDSPMPLERRRAYAESYLVENRAELTEEAAAWILARLQVRNPAKRAAKLKADADKAAAKKAAEEAKRETRDALEYGKRLADMTPEAVRAWAKESAPHAVKGQLKHARAWHKVASREGKAKLKVALWARIKLLADLVAVSEETARIRDKNRYLRDNVKTVRHFLRSLQTDEPAASTWSYAQAMREVAKYAPKRGMSAASANRLRMFADITDSDGPIIAKQEAARRERVAAERKARAERAEAERVAREAATRAAWFAGDTSARWRGEAPDGSAYVRAVGVERNEAGEVVAGTLQTSQGADVPLTHAIRAFRFLKAVRARASAWTRNGKTIRVGHFQVDRIDSDGSFRAGCHRFAWPEIERLAAELGLVDLAPLPLTAADETEH